MPSRRDLVSMSEEEAIAFLRSQCRAVLATISKDGMPHLVNMSYGVDPEGRIVMSSFAKSQKVKNMERDPRATVSVESGGAYAEIRSVMAQCAVEILREAEDVRANIGFIRSAYSKNPSEGVKEQVENSMTKRVIMRFTPGRLISWDHSRLAGKY